MHNFKKLGADPQHWLAGEAVTPPPWGEILATGLVIMYMYIFVLIVSM